MNRSFFALLILIFFAENTAAQNAKSTDGTIVENAPCAVQPKRSYEQYAEGIKKRSREEADQAAREGFKWDFERDFKARLLSKEEFERQESFNAYDCQKIKYLSDGLKVVGFIWKPKNSEGKKLPLVIANRGGNRELSMLSPRSFFYPFVTNGFVVIASQYRGTDGGEGMEEFGGADVNDVLNLIPLAKSLGYVDMNNVFMVGASRGGMMTYLALKKGIPVNAVAVWSGVSDLTEEGKRRPGMIANVWRQLIPDYDKRSEEALRERSAVYWAEKINVPVFIMHGSQDWRATAGGQALPLASKLQSLGKTYQLLIYAGDDHGIWHNRFDKEQRTIEWFKKYMK